MKLFVGNLPWTTTEEELSQVFAAYGIVDQVRIIIDRDTGRSRGFGFVEMPDTREAEAAIEGLNGTALGGRTLSVSEARDRDERPRRSRW
jgi:RNA recognition motif-containing protein